MGAFTNAKSFEISCTGGKTGETWAGKFEAKKVLSQADEINIDRKYRELLGPNSQDASVAASKRALTLAEVFVRVTSAPDWWVAVNYGAGLLDDEPLVEVYNGAMKIEADHAVEVKERAEKAREALKGIAPKV